MSYASLTDLEERLGSAAYVQLTDDVGTGAADEGVANEALAGVAGEVNSYLARRYAVPVSTADEPEVAALLKSITLDLAEYRLYSRRSNVPQFAQTNREAAFRWLQLVAGGQVVLPTRGEAAGNSATVFAGESNGPQRVLSRKELENL